jgi:asparagine synthase (glutamine-hydrolysing)
MSFLAVFNADGAPIDGEMVGHLRGETQRHLKLVGPSRLTAFMWSVPDAELEDKDARHAVELDGQFWLLGRIRLDRRDELGALLAASATEPDALLCLRAYARWSERCVDHLRGDFCFVLWDEGRRRLFCARDQLGVRPLFYGRANNSWFVSDSLDAVVRAPGLTGELDDFWIVDFLTGPLCLDFDRTVYKHVKRLAPAHTLVVSRDGGAAKRYWTLEFDEPIFYRRRGQYLDHFHDVLARAIRDRLPEGRVGISMSGGLDSTTLAAKTVEVTGDASRVVAFTNYFKRLIHDKEPYFSELVAKRLGIGHTLRASDDAYDFQLNSVNVLTHEPGGPSVHKTAQRAIETEMADAAKVWFFGEGPDNALTFEWPAHLRWLARRRDWTRLLGAVGQYIRGKETLEWLTTIKNLRSPRHGTEGSTLTGFPEWIDKEFVERLDLAARARRLTDHLRLGPTWRPVAMASFASPIWQMYFEYFDPALSGSSLDIRHPYVDLEVLSFMLRTPPIPWGRRKHLIREAMRGRLPDEVLARDKAPLVVDPNTRVVRKTPLPPLSINPALRRFIDPTKLPDDSGETSGIDPLEKVRTLDAWLKSRQQ